MSTTTKDGFLAIAQNALERMAFVITEPGTETVGEILAQASFHAVIDIEASGRDAWLSVSATSGMVREIAGGMLGLDAEEIDVDQHGEPTVAELANILGGELVMAMGGDRDPLRLGLPRELADVAVGESVHRALRATGGWSCVLKSETGALLIACSTG